MTSSRMGLAALQRLTRDASDRTLDAKVKVEKKRAERKKVAAAAPKPEVPQFSTEVGQPRPKLVNSVQVECWFREGLQLLYGGKLEIPQRGKWWTAADRKNAKTLVELYGADDVKKAVLHFCATWLQRVAASDGVLAGIPSIGYLFYKKDVIFAEVKGLAHVPEPKDKTSKRAKNMDFDEYRPPKKPNDVGWYI